VIPLLISIPSIPSCIAFCVSFCVLIPAPQYISVFLLIFLVSLIICLIFFGFVVVIDFFPPISSGISNAIAVGLSLAIFFVFFRLSVQIIRFSLCCFASFMVFCISFSGIWCSEWFIMLPVAPAFFIACIVV